MTKILKGVIALSVIGMVVALAAGPALADGVQVIKGNDYTKVKNEITALSDTGMNGIANSWNEKGGFEGDISSGNWDNTINTGDATAKAGAANVVNSNVYLGDGCCGPEVQVNKYADYTKVKNDIFAGAYTGGNGIANSGNSMGGFGGDISSNNDGNTIDTGDATAMAGAANLVNSNLALTCDGECCDPEVQINKSNDKTKVKNLVWAESSTGGNSIAESVNSMGGFYGDGYGISSDNDGNLIETGTANSAAGAITVVNTNIKRTWSY